MPGDNETRALSNLSGKTLVTQTHPTAGPTSSGTIWPLKFGSAPIISGTSGWLPGRPLSLTITSLFDRITGAVAGASKEIDRGIKSYFGGEEEVNVRSESRFDSTTSRWTSRATLPTTTPS